MSARDGFGKAKEGSGIEIFRIGEDKTEQFRLFPPKGKLAAAGKWALYHQQHYGYGVPDAKDPNGKPRLRPFMCVEEKDGDKVIVSCPECRKIEDRERTRDEQKAAELKRLTDLGVDKATALSQATKSVELASEWLKAHNLDRKWYMLAMTEDGRIGYLVIPHKAKKALDVKKKKLAADEKIDVLDIDNGAWVEITRTGSGRNTEYTADIAMEQVVTASGARAKVTRVSAFTEQQLEQALALPDLDSGSIIRRLTREQVRMLAEGTGAPEEVEAIMNLGQKTDVAAPRREASPEPVRSAPAPTKAASEPAKAASEPAKAAPTQVAAQDPAAVIAALQAQIAALQPKAATEAPGQMAAMDVKAMSDDEFISKFGAKAK